MLKKLSNLSGDLYKEMEALAHVVEKAEAMVSTADILDTAKYYHDPVFSQMEKTRAIADEIESMVGAKYWPYPTYGDLLFSVL